MTYVVVFLVAGVVIVFAGTALARYADAIYAAALWLLYSHSVGT